MNYLPVLTLVILFGCIFDQVQANASPSFNFDYFNTILVWNGTEFGQWQNTTQLQFRIDAPTILPINGAGIISNTGVLYMSALQWNFQTKEWCSVNVPNLYHNGNNLDSDSNDFSEDNSGKFFIKLSSALETLDSTLYIADVDNRPSADQVRLCPMLSNWRISEDVNVFLLGTPSNTTFNKAMKYYDYMILYTSPIVVGTCNTSTGLDADTESIISTLFESAIFRIYPWTSNGNVLDMDVLLGEEFDNRNKTLRVVSSMVEVQTTSSDDDTFATNPNLFAWDILSANAILCSENTDGIDSKASLRAQVIFKTPFPSLQITEIQGVTLECQQGICKIESMQCIDVETAFYSSSSSSAVNVLALNAKIIDSSGRKLYAYVVLTTENDIGDRVDERRITDLFMDFMGSVSFAEFLGVLSFILIFMLVVRYSCEYACNKRKQQNGLRDKN